MLLKAEDLVLQGYSAEINLTSNQPRLSPDSRPDLTAELTLYHNSKISRCLFDVEIRRSIIGQSSLLICIEAGHCQVASPIWLGEQSQEDIWPTLPQTILLVQNSKHRRFHVSTTCTIYGELGMVGLAKATKATKVRY